MTTPGSSVAVGIDVAEAKKGLDLVALDHNRKVTVSCSKLKPEEVVKMTIELRPSVVCVDSPSGWSTSGPSRLAERELAKIGIQSFRTGPDPGDHPFYGWMRVGFEIFKLLSSSYPLYRSCEVQGHAAEIFPHASACLLANGLPSPGAPKLTFRRAALANAGVSGKSLPTIDAVDAALAALTGLIALEGGHSTVGDPDEGVILLPVPSVPTGHLPLADSGKPAGKDEVPEPPVEATTSRTPGARLDFERAARFIASVPAGRWTSYKDVAIVAGNERAAQAVGQRLARSGHKVPHVHRVIRSDGFVADGFHAAGPGVPSDAPTARSVLEREGVRFDNRGRASRQQRFRPAQWDGQ